MVKRSLPVQSLETGDASPFRSPKNRLKTGTTRALLLQSGFCGDIVRCRIKAMRGITTLDRIGALLNGERGYLLLTVYVGAALSQLISFAVLLGLILILFAYKGVELYLRGRIARADESAFRAHPPTLASQRYMRIPLLFQSAILLCMSPLIFTTTETTPTWWFGYALIAYGVVGMVVIHLLPRKEQTSRRLLDADRGRSVPSSSTDDPIPELKWGVLYHGNQWLLVGDSRCILRIDLEEESAPLSLLVSLRGRGLQILTGVRSTYVLNNCAARFGYEFCPACGNSMEGRPSPGRCTKCGKPYDLWANSMILHLHGIKDVKPLPEHVELPA